MDGLHKLCKCIKNRGLRHATVTNTPRENVELMISIEGLIDFFEFWLLKIHSPYFLLIASENNISFKSILQRILLHEFHLYP